MTKIKYKVLIVLSLFLIAIPFTAFGLTGSHNLECADFTFYNSASCTNDIVTLADLNVSLARITNTEKLPSDGQTVYISYTVSNNNNFRLDIENEVTYSVNGNQTDLEMSRSGTNTYISFGHEYPYEAPYGGDFSNICITDTIGGCSDDPPAEPATSTATSTTAMADIGFGIAIIITLLFFGIIQFTFWQINSNKKKAWK